MQDVNSIGALASPATLRAFAGDNESQQRSTRSDPAGDRVEISELAQTLSRLAGLTDDRARKIVDVRNAIRDGRYVTAEKLDVAIDRLLQELEPAAA